MPAVSIDELTDVLPLWRGFSDDRAVVSKEMSHEELAEIFLELLHGHLRNGVGRLKLICVYLHSHVLAHVHGVGERVINWVQLL